MAISVFVTRLALSISTTEISIVSGTSTLATDTTDGVFQCWVDLTNTAKGDEFALRAYEAVSGGTKRQIGSPWTFLGARGARIVPTPPLIMVAGWDFTLQRIAGADRTFDVGIRQVS